MLVDMLEEILLLKEDIIMPGFMNLKMSICQTVLLNRNFN